MSLTHARHEPSTYRVQVNDSMSPFRYMVNPAVADVSPHCFDAKKVSPDIGLMQQHMPLLRSKRAIDRESELQYRTHPLSRNPNTQYPNLSRPDTIGDTFHHRLPAVDPAINCAMNEQANHTRMEQPLIRREWRYPSNMVPLGYNPQDLSSTGRFDSFVSQLYEKDHYKFPQKQVVDATNDVSRLQHVVASKIPDVVAKVMAIPPPPSVPTMPHAKHEPFFFGGCGC